MTKTQRRELGRALTLTKRALADMDRLNYAVDDAMSRLGNALEICELNARHDATKAYLNAVRTTVTDKGYAAWNGHYELVRTVEQLSELLEL